MGRCLSLFHETLYAKCVHDDSPIMVTQSGGRTAPQRMFGSAQRHFWLSQLGETQGGVLLGSNA